MVIIYTVLPYAHTEAHTVHTLNIHKYTHKYLQPVAPTEFFQRGGQMGSTEKTGVAHQSQKPEFQEFYYADKAG